MWEESGNDTVDIGSSHADGDQREHIQATVDNRSPTSLKEGPSTPEDHRSRQQKLEPVKELGRNNTLDRLPGNHVGHGKQSDRRAQNDANPKPPCHVDQFRVDFVLQGYSPGLEGHAADWAGAGLGAHDLRMHGTHVLGLDRRSGWPRLRRAHFGVHRTDVGSLLGFIYFRGVHSMLARGCLHQLLRFFVELGHTVMATKKISLPVVNALPGGVAWVHVLPQIGSIMTNSPDAGECLMSLDFTEEPGLKLLKLSHDAVL